MSDLLTFCIILFIIGSILCLHPKDLNAELTDEKQSGSTKPTLFSFKASTTDAERRILKNQQFQYEIIHQLNDTGKTSQVISFRIPFDAVTLREMNEHFFSCSLSALGIDSKTTGVITDVIKTITATHLHLVFMSEPDHCLLSTLWDAGIVLELFDSHSWWVRLSDINYLSHSQHALVGSLDWIVMTMEKVKLLYNNASMNSFNTRWIWVSSALEPSVSALSPYYDRIPFGDALKKLTMSLQEGIRGVIVFRERTNFYLSSGKPGNVSLSKSEVKIGSILDSGDGSWILKDASRWSSGNVTFYRPLWPRPSFDLQNRTLRFTCLNKPTVFEYKVGGGFDDAVGFANDVMLIVRRHLNFSEVLVPTNGFGAKDTNGNWNGMVGVLHRKEADIAPLDFTPSYSRSEVVDFATPIGEDVVFILSRAPTEVIRPFLLLQIFSLEVWACIMCSVLALGVALEIADNIESSLSLHSIIRNWTFQQMANSLKIFVYQGSRHWPIGNGSRLIASCGIVVAIIVDSVYTGSITAFFAIPFRSKPIDSVDQLLSSSIGIAIRSKTNTYSTMVLNENGILHEGIDRVSLFSGSELSTWEFFRLIADGTFAYVDGYTSVVGRANSFESRNEKCKFYYGKEPVRINADVFAFMKNSPVFYQFDKTMQWLRYYGIIERAKKKYYSAVCDSKASSSSIKPMSAEQVQGSFYILGIGLLFGYVIFLVEVIWLKIV